MSSIFKIKKPNFLSFFCLIGLSFAMDISELSYCGIDFQVKKNGFSDVSYILIHGDEETARMLLSEHIKKIKEKLFLLSQKKERSFLGQQRLIRIEYFLGPELEKH